MIGSPSFFRGIDDIVYRTAIVLDSRLFRSMIAVIGMRQARHRTLYPEWQATQAAVTSESAR